MCNDFIGLNSKQSYRVTEEENVWQSNAGL